MQQRGTQAAHNTLLRLGKREEGWRKQYIHTIANEVVTEAVEQVAPNHTSTRCSRTDCGFTHDDNRDGQQFECQKCGYEVNADYNAAKNIGVRYARKRRHRLRSSLTSGNGDAPVNVRINSGTVNGESYQPIVGD